MRGTACIVAWLTLTPAVAAAASTLSIGEGELSYTEVFSKDTDDDGKPDRLSYYDGEQLVAAAYDRDGDGVYDAWVTFDDELRPTSEVVDRDRDGSPDVLRPIDEHGYASDDRKLRGQPPPPAPERSAPAPAVSREDVTDIRFLAAVGVAVLGLIGGLVVLRRR